MNTFLLIVLLLLGPHLLGAVEAHRQYGPWVSSRLGGGGYLQRIAISPTHPEVLYLATDVGGAYRSEDGGHTWHMLHGALPAGEGSTHVRGLVVHPTEPRRLLLAVGSAWDTRGIYASEDGGESFRLVFSGRFEGNGNTRATGTILVNAPDGSETVYACPIGLGPQKSVDFGRTWEPLNLPDVYPQDFVVDRTDARRLWLNASDRKTEVFRAGLFFSEDGGTKWVRVSSSDVPKEMVQDPLDARLLHGVFAAAPQLRRSRDDGRTWHAYANPELLPPPGGNAREDGTYSALAVGPDFLLAGAHGGTFYRLPAGGDTWERLPEAVIRDAGWYAGHGERIERHFGAALGFVGIVPNDANRWYFTDWYACYRTGDAGRSWELSIDGIEMSVLHCLAQDPEHPERIHAGMADIGYFQSTDGGETFAKESWGRHRGISNNIKCIAVCPQAPQTLYATGPITWKWAATQTFRSRDGGARWMRPAQRGLPTFSDTAGPRCNTIAVHPAHPEEVYLAVSGPIRAGEGGVYRSRNGGDDWVWFGEGLPAEKKLFRHDIWTTGPEIAVSPDGTVLATAHDSGKVFRRGPRDTEWTAVELPGRSSIVVADPHNARRFYIARRDKGLFRTDDGGETWQTVFASEASTVAVDTACVGRIAVSRDGAISLSRDGGDTWEDLPGTPPHRSWRQVLCFAGNRLIAGTAGSGIFYREISDEAITVRAL